MVLKKNIRELSDEELDIFFIENNIKKYKKKQLIEWLWKKGCTSFSHMTNLPNSLISDLENYFDFNFLTLKKNIESKDKTIKVIFEQSKDNTLLEGVLIPTEDRVTACISSQTGCSLACAFCATAKIKKFNNLSSGEIYDQVFILNNLSIEKFGKKLTNIVLMGMGEPLMNFSNVIKALKHIISTNGLAFAPSRITLSTVGVSKNIFKLADENLKINLAVSLHSANESTRNKIIPYNTKDTLEMLSEAIVYFNKKTKIRITVEYLLLNNINDSIKDAQDLAKFCKSFPCKINLIEYNQVEGSEFLKSPIEKTEKFKEFLRSKNLIVITRKSRGQDVEAACGQLVAKSTVVGKN